MKRKTFLIISLATMFLMIGWFSMEVISMAETACLPRIDSNCLNTMQQICNSAGGEHVGHQLTHSTCESGSCYGLWKFFCAVGRTQRQFWVYCQERGNWMCDNW